MIPYRLVFDDVFFAFVMNLPGLALSKSLRVIGVAAGSSAYRAKIPAGAYVIKVYQNRSRYCLLF